MLLLDSLYDNSGAFPCICCVLNLKLINYRCAPQLLIWSGVFLGQISTCSSATKEQVFSLQCFSTLGFFFNTILTLFYAQPPNFILFEVLIRSQITSVSSIYAPPLYPIIPPLLLLLLLLPCFALWPLISSYHCLFFKHIIHQLTTLFKCHYLPLV